MSEETKVCCRCKVNKPKADFAIRNKRRGAVQSKCKTCMSEYKKERYWANHEVELAKYTKSRLRPENAQQRKEYYEKNKEAYRERHYKYQSDEEKRANRLQKSRERYIKNRDKIRERHKKNGQKPEVKAAKRERHYERKETDINYNIKRRLRCRLRHIVKALGSDTYKQTSSIELLGCDMEFFKSHIESKFKDGMCWSRLPEIHLDHIKPCVLFDLTDMEQQKACFHYSNIQPLWAIDNLRKNTKYLEQENV